MCHVLVIEDEVMIALYLSDLVEDAGATSVAIAMTEAQAIERADAQLPDLIVSDVILPGGGSGPSAVSRIRQMHGEVPTIFVTANPGSCLDCDYAAAILPKPVQARVLIEQVVQIARSGSPQQP